MKGTPNLTQSITQDGCKFHDKCASCPFPDCIKYGKLSAKITMLIKAGYSDGQIAAILCRSLGRTQELIDRCRKSE